MVSPSHSAPSRLLQHLLDLPEAERSRQQPHASNVEQQLSPDCAVPQDFCADAGCHSGHIAMCTTSYIPPNTH